MSRKWRCFLYFRHEKCRRSVRVDLRHSDIVSAISINTKSSSLGQEDEGAFFQKLESMLSQNAPAVYRANVSIIPSDFQHFATSQQWSVLIRLYIPENEHYDDALSPQNPHIREVP